MSEKMDDFIKKLAALCSEYGAELSYTTDDDGVHVTIGDENLCIGWPTLPDPGADILMCVANNAIQRTS